MTRGGPTRVIGASLGLSAFAIAIVVGLAAGNPADTILVRAVAAMIVCNVVGLCIGLAAERTALDAIAAYERHQTSPPGEAVPAAAAQVKGVEDILKV